MKRVRIINDDGITRNTKIVNADTGIALPDVTKASILLDAKEDLVKVELDFLFPELDLVAQVVKDRVVLRTGMAFSHCGQLVHFIAAANDRYFFAVGKGGAYLLMFDEVLKLSRLPESDWGSLPSHYQRL